MSKKRKPFGFEELIGIIVFLFIVAAGFAGGMVWQRDSQNQKKVEHASIYIKCYQVAQFIKEQEEDMGSTTSLPERLFLRCEELSNG